MLHRFIDVLGREPGSSQYDPLTLKTKSCRYSSHFADEQIGSKCSPDHTASSVRGRGVGGGGAEPDVPVVLLN